MKHANARQKDAAPSSISGRMLRQRAEAIAVMSPEDMEALSPDEIRQTLHDLRVHQIELEMQNEELRRTQAELDAARARYFDLYDLAPVGYCTLSEKGLILEANLTAATLLGAARNALVKQPITRFILKEDQDIYYLHRKQLVETGKPQACELRMVREDGTQLWARLEAAAAQDADGAPVCRVVMSDITRHKQAEILLRRSEEHLKKSQEIAHLGSWELDLTNNQLTWSDEVYRIFGLDSQEFDATYEAFLEAAHPEDRAAVDDAYSGSLREGRDVYEIEHRIVKKPNGEIRHVHEKCEHLQDTSGKVIRSVGMVQDITERKRAEETLRLAQLELEASHRNYLELYDFAPVGYFTLDETGLMLEANITCATLLAVERAHLIKQSFGQFVFADDQDVYHSFQNRLFEAVSTQSCELRLNTQTDPPIYVKLDSATRVDSNGDITQAWIAMSDVSIQKQVEQQSLALAVEREKTEIVRTFLENAAHNIRTPLTILNTTLYLLEQERVLEHQKSRFGVINIQVKRLMNLVENMFTLMHMNELADFQFDYLDLNALVTDVVDEQRLLTEQQGLTCTFYPDASLSQVWADSTYLASAISNLVMNALNYTPSGGKVRVRTDRRNTNAEISVEDNGIGIGVADLPHVFERFFRSNLAINTSQHGTGLGLSITEKIIKAHGGHIEVDSEPGKGSTFRICLPIEPDEASNSAPASSL